MWIVKVGKNAANYDTGRFDYYNFSTKKQAVAFCERNGIAATSIEKM